ncbi:peptide ABC transporter permease [Sinorhizobium fredii USDA 205]|uniref:ABC transporter permease subunit n=1 Tax=Rhizobium fredii TaxID=380 RepID=A0A844AEC8_RHIFR|nr:ABC transporter permease [Sinorhizobium fredii]ASY72640.1 Dipeptide transport system permease protein DppB [Sinorhizobium fredii CCBAU 83666]AWM28781.1 Dipeptide transport system permease protein DppB [Sinorhizobium fredii CCBAU 25509]KSV85381.1 peptide ABC transporter permease [Sinorhizobium fredii USDA 205]MCG5473803.1 ABC transporter permease [Sinorhizobium fredii]MQW98583.1 ABC transporter permease subunit [Sinorhizobium fredii]
MTSRYLLGRVGQALLVLWAAFTVSFVLLQAMPGDAILIKFQNPDLGLTAQQIAEIRASYGAEGPLWLQYIHSIGNFLTGNFGYSVQAGVPVSASLAAHLPVTLKLAMLGFLLASIFAVAIAFLSSLAPFAWLRSAIQSIPSLFISVPTFWLGIMLIQIFSFRLKLVPVINPDPWQEFILPVITLAVPISAPLAQVLVRNIDEVLTRPFVAVARAKGATRNRVLWRHVAKNALLPTLTIAGVLFGELIAGAVVTETVFGLNGIGGLTERAVGSQDAAVLQAIVVLSAAAFVIINLIVDLVFPILDPRLRTNPGAAA